MLGSCWGDFFVVLLIICMKYILLNGCVILLIRGMDIWGMLVRVVLISFLDGFEVD